MKKDSNFFLTQNYELKYAYKYFNVEISILKTIYLNCKL